MRPVITDLYPNFRPTVDVRDAELAASEDHYRQVAYGEALRCMSIYARLDPMSLPDRRADALLDRAYLVMNLNRPGFTPEEFTLYFLSTLIDLVEDDERRQLRRGAARYLLENRHRLSGDIAGLDGEAKHLLSNASSAATPTTARPVEVGKLRSDGAKQETDAEVAFRLARAIAADEFVLSIPTARTLADEYAGA